jgi:hypothetical protein
MKMLKSLLAGLLLSLFAALPTHAQTDAYGGLTSVKCANTTGWFHVEKLGNQWWFCDPLGNGYSLRGVYAVTYLNQAIVTKYGTLTDWATQTVDRLQSWGFNGLGAYTTDHILPTSSFVTAKMPFIEQLNGGLYAMENPVVQTPAGNIKMLPIGSEVKGMSTGWTSIYTGYRPPTPDFDIYDPNLAVWLNAYLAANAPAMLASPSLNYMIGWQYDDTDWLFGFGAGPNFNNGHVNPHLAWLTATMTPVQSVSQLFPTVYTNQTVYTKAAWRNYLLNKYGSIVALNAAWKSNYTTFGTTGVQVVNEPVGTGDGVTTTFTHTLLKLPASSFSVQVLVNGRPVEGDMGNSKLFGPGGQGGTISYPSGALVAILIPAPAKGSFITVSYIQNGWRYGTGVMDEDGRAAHQAWLGKDWNNLTGASPAVVADMNAFLVQLAEQYMQTFKTAIKKYFPNSLQLGPLSIGSWGEPARAQILQAAAQVLDVLSDSQIIIGDTQYQQRIDFVEANLGDKPIVTGSYLRANPDSPYAAFTTTADYPTQADRGGAYFAATAQMLQLAYTATGSHPYIGQTWWQYTDNTTENANWGLVTVLDNAYDGHEAVIAKVSCSAPLQAYACGGEKGNYGNVMEDVKLANALPVGSVAAVPKLKHHVRISQPVHKR